MWAVRVGIKEAKSLPEFFGWDDDFTLQMGSNRYKPGRLETRAPVSDPF